MTWASQLALSKGGARTRRTKRRKTKARKTKRRTSKKRKMKFGSPAWQKKFKVGKFAKRRK